MLTKYIYIRAVKMAEKLNSNFVPKYYQNSNLKGIISVRGKKSFWLLPWGHKRAKYELNRAKYD